MKAHRFGKKQKKYGGSEMTKGLRSEKKQTVEEKIIKALRFGKNKKRREAIKL